MLFNKLFNLWSLFIILFSILLFASCAEEYKEPIERSKPNIILIVADDAGWHDVGYHGSEINTPNIDRLCEAGVELDQFYVYPTCSPTRAALLTGKYASRFGIGEPIAMKSKQVLPTNVETLPAALKKEGYQTAITGKWHLGLSLESGPSNYGFDYTYGYLHGQVDQFTHRYKNGDRTWYRNNEFVDEAGHATDLITKEAINYITEIRDTTKPFFVYLAYSVPHYPLQEEDKWIEPYKALDDIDSRKLFNASMSHMDYAIGKVIKTLEDKKLLENTIIVFMSDNGGQQSWYPAQETSEELYDGKHGPYPKLGNNYPLRGYKTDLYEGGVRVPAFIYWKNHLKQNKVEQLIKVTDLFPTLVSVVDTTLISSLNLDGNNMWLALTDSEFQGDRDLYLRVPNKFVLRKGDWKLVHLGKTIDEGKDELYNLNIDPNEKNNVAKDYPEVKKKLFDILKSQVDLD